MLTAVGKLKFFAAICASVCVCGAHIFTENIIEIGKPDASAAEFNDVGIDFNAARYYFDETKTDPYVKEFFAAPLRFDARSGRAEDFSFVIPVKNCEWADASFKRESEMNFYYPHENRYGAYRKKKEFLPSTILFNLDSAPEKDLYFKMGFVDKAPIAADIKIKVSANGKEVGGAVSIPYRRTPQNKYPCFENILFNSKTWGIPAGISVKIPASALREGENEISFRA